MSEPSTTSVPRRRGDDLLAGLAERVGAKLVTSTVFGEAVARFGLGGGSGSDPRKGQEGEGGGAGGMVVPAGYIELKDGRSRFVPVVHPARMLALILGALVAVAAIVRPPTAAPARRLPSLRRRS